MPPNPRSLATAARAALEAIGRGSPGGFRQGFGRGFTTELDASGAIRAGTRGSRFASSVVFNRAPQELWQDLNPLGRLGYVTGRTAQDVVGHGTRARVLFDAYPLDFVQGRVTEALVQQGLPSWYARPGGYAAATALGLGAGNLNLGNLAEAARPAGFQAMMPQQGNLRQTENPVGEYIARGFFGQTGRILPWNEFRKERPDVSYDQYQGYLKMQRDRSFISGGGGAVPYVNVGFGAFRIVPNNPIAGGPTFTSLGYNVNFPGALAAGATAAGALYAGRQLLGSQQQQPTPPPPTQPGPAPQPQAARPRPRVATAPPPQQGNLNTMGQAIPSRQKATQQAGISSSSQAPSNTSQPAPARGAGSSSSNVIYEQAYEQARRLNLRTPQEVIDQVLQYAPGLPADPTAQQAIAQQFITRQQREASQAARQSGELSFRSTEDQAPALFRGRQGLRARLAGGISSMGQIRIGMPPGDGGMPPASPPPSPRSPAPSMQRQQLIGDMAQQVDQFMRSGQNRQWLRVGQASDGEPLASLYIRNRNRFLQGQTLPAIDIAAIDLHPSIQRQGIGNEIIRGIQQRYPDRATYIESIGNQGWGQALESRYNWLRDPQDGGYSLYQMPPNYAQNPTQSPVQPAAQVVQAQRAPRVASQEDAQLAAMRSDYNRLQREILVANDSKDWVLHEVRPGRYNLTEVGKPTNYLTNASREDVLSFVRNPQTPAQIAPPTTPTETPLTGTIQRMRALRQRDIRNTAEMLGAAGQAVNAADRAIQTSDALINEFSPDIPALPPGRSGQPAPAIGLEATPNRPAAVRVARQGQPAAPRVAFRQMLQSARPPAAQSPRVVFLGRGNQPPASSSEPTLEELFKRADEIGNKYQTPGEPPSLGANRQARQILNETGYSGLVDRAMGRPALPPAGGTTRPAEPTIADMRARQQESIARLRQQPTPPPTGTSGEAYRAARQQFARMDQPLPGSVNYVRNYDQIQAQQGTREVLQGIRDARTEARLQTRAPGATGPTTPLINPPEAYRAPATPAYTPYPRSQSRTPEEFTRRVITDELAAGRPVPSAQLTAGRQAVAFNLPRPQPEAPPVVAVTPYQDRTPSTFRPPTAVGQAQPRTVATGQMAPTVPATTAPNPPRTLSGAARPARNLPAPVVAPGAQSGSRSGLSLNDFNGMNLGNVRGRQVATTPAPAPVRPSRAAQIGQAAGLGLAAAGTALDTGLELLDARRQIGQGQETVGGGLIRGALRPVASAASAVPDLALSIQRGRELTPAPLRPLVPVQVQGLVGGTIRATEAATGRRLTPATREEQGLQRAADAVQAAPSRAADALQNLARLGQGQGSVQAERTANRAEAQYQQAVANRAQQQLQRAQSDPGNRLYWVNGRAVRAADYNRQQQQQRAARVAAPPQRVERINATAPGTPSSEAQFQQAIASGALTRGLAPAPPSAYDRPRQQPRQQQAPAQLTGSGGIRLQPGVWERLSPEQRANLNRLNATPIRLNSMEMLAQPEVNVPGTEQFEALPPQQQGQVLRNFQSRQNQARSAASRERVATQNNAARIRVAEMSGQTRRDVADLTSSRQLQGRQYVSDNNLIGTQYRADLALEGQDLVSRRRLEGTRYTADQRLRGQDLTSARRLEGTRYTADQRLAGVDLTSDRRLTGQMYTADRRLEGTRYTADRRVNAADVTARGRLAGQMYTADRNVDREALRQTGAIRVASIRGDAALGVAQINSGGRVAAAEAQAEGRIAAADSAAQARAIASQQSYYAEIERQNRRAREQANQIALQQQQWAIRAGGY